MTAEGLTAAAQTSAIAAAQAAATAAALVKLSGDVVQQVYASSGAVSTVSTIIPYDDTIPQITEGTEILTATLTPASASNYLEIEAVVHVAGNATSGYLIGALFQDATANALMADIVTYTGAGFQYQLTVRCRVLAGTTSATTIRLRVGPGSGTTTQVTINGSAAARVLGGVYISSLTVTEIKA